MPTILQIEVAATILRRARMCEAPLQEDGTLPCPYCRWGWGDDDQNDETGCLFVAEEMLKAAEDVR